MIHAENSNNYSILSKKKLLIEAIDLFETNYSQGKNVAAVLITENGKEHEQLLGIVTPYDLPKMEKLIRPI